MTYLRPDILALNSHLTNIASSANLSIANLSEVTNSINNLGVNFTDLTSITEEGLNNININLDGMYYKIDELVEVTKSMNDMLFMQNQKQIELLTSIDNTLKGPNKTAANEQFEFGMELLKRNKIQQSIKMFEESINLNPIQYRSYAQLAVIYLQLKDYKKALEYIKESLDFLPEDESLYTNCHIIAYTNYLAARCYQKNNQIEIAYQHINKSVHLHQLSQYYYEKAIYAAQLDKWNDAALSLIEAIKRKTKYFYLAMIETSFKPYDQKLESLLRSQKANVSMRVKEFLKKYGEGKVPFPQYSRNHQVNRTPYPLQLGISKYNENLGKIQAIDSYDMLYYTYTNLFEHFHRKYSDLQILYRNRLKEIEDLVNNNSYEDLVKADSMTWNFKKDFNQLSDKIYRFVENFNSTDYNINNNINTKIKDIEYDIQKNKQRMKALMENKLFKWQMSKYEKDSYIEKEKNIKNLEEELKELKDTLPKVKAESEKIRLFCKEIMEEKPLPYMN